MFGYNLWELFLKGGVVMWPLLLCSIAALALALDRAWAVWRAGGDFEKLRDGLGKHLAAGRLDEAKSFAAGSRGPAARVAEAYLSVWNESEAVRQEVVQRAAGQSMEAIERRLSWLAVLAQVTPLLGLLGTVIGLMAAFQAMDTKGTQVKSSDLATGIWQKLLNTSFGLAIAIPCLMVYFFLEGRLNRIQDRVNWIISHLNEWHARGGR
jgi:biopolymer transport protein ExbB